MRFYLLLVMLALSSVRVQCQGAMMNQNDIENAAGRDSTSEDEKGEDEAGTIYCTPDSICPPCSACEDGKCVFCDAVEGDTDCSDDPCRRGYCVDIGDCSVENRPDGLECGSQSSEVCMNGECVYLAYAIQDPHMRGFQGQAINWKGEDGGWYALLSDSNDIQLNVRVTSPLREDFPERQQMTGMAIKYRDNHSLVIETKHPYSTATVEDCPEESLLPCLSENAVRITVDGVEQRPVPTESTHLPGGVVMMAMNLPPECQPYGGDVIWADTFAKMTSRRLVEQPQTFPEWVGTWSSSSAAPTWCKKFLEEKGTDGTLTTCSKHSVFKIQTPAFTMRLHHGTNHQGGEILADGRIVPALEFWQMDLHLEWYNLNKETVTGMLGETMRPVLDEEGSPIMSGNRAMRGSTEDYRVSAPLASDFHLTH